MTTEDWQQAIHARHTIRHLADTLDRIHIERATGPDTLRAAARHHLEAIDRLIGELDQHARRPASTITRDGAKMLAELVELHGAPKTYSFPAEALAAAIEPHKVAVWAPFSAQALDDLRPDQQTGGLPVPPSDSIDPLDGFTLGYDRGYIGIGLHCATCTDQAGDIGMSDSEALAEIDDGTPLADVIELARTHHQRHEEQ